MDSYTIFARFYDIFLYIFLSKLRKRVVSIARCYNPETIIDICCGTGNQLKYLRNAGFTNVYGIDISPAMVKQSQNEYNTIKCDIGDAGATNYTSNSFDMGIISFALHEKPYAEAQNIIKEATRIVRSGGYLVIVDYYFDKSSSRIPRFLINIIERIAGKYHFSCFKSYLKFGGLDYLMNHRDYLESYRSHQNTIITRVYELERIMRS